jgi:hypothetical protein
MSEPTAPLSRTPAGKNHAASFEAGTTGQLPKTGCDRTGKRAIRSSLEIIKGDLSIECASRRTVVRKQPQIVPNPVAFSS